MLHEAYVAILRRAPNVELLMAVATAGSLLLGDVLEAASVGAIVSLMDVIKMLAVERFERQLARHGRPQAGQHLWKPNGQLAQAGPSSCAL